MAVNEQLQIEIKAQSRQAVKELQKSEKAVSGLSKAVKSLGLAAAGFAALRAGTRFLRDSAKAAADAEEVQSKFNAVFKEGAADVRDWANQYAESVGRSNTETEKFLSTLQDTFVPLGFARDAAAEMSKEVVTLAFDLASFNNLPTEQVINDIQSALVGNVETLRKYGVVANQAAIEQKALELGMEKTGKTFAAQDKAAAILAITLEGTTDAQGDLRRTMDSTANITRQFDTQILTLKENIGGFVNEGLTPLRKSLIGVLEQVNKNIEGMRNWSAVLRGDGTIEQLQTAIAERQEQIRKLEEGGVSRGEQRAYDNARNHLTVLSQQLRALQEIENTQARINADAAEVEPEETGGETKAEREARLQIEARERLASMQERWRQDEIRGEQERVQAITDAETRVIELKQLAHEQTLAMIEQEKQARMDTITTVIGGFSQFFSELAGMYDKDSEEGKKARKKAFIAAKAFNVGESIMNTANAVTKALSAAPPPFNFIMAAAVGAFGAAKTALIAARPVPMAEGGIVMPRAGGTLAQLGEAGKPEAVIPLDRMGSMGITVNVYGTVGSQEEVALWVQQGIERAHHMGRVA